MNFLGLGIALLIIGILLSVVPVFGQLSGPLVYIGWILVVVGIALAVFQFITARTGTGRTGRSM